MVPAGGRAITALLSHSIMFRAPGWYRGQDASSDSHRLTAQSEPQTSADLSRGQRNGEFGRASSVWHPSALVVAIAVKRVRSTTGRGRSALAGRQPASSDRQHNPVPHCLGPSSNRWPASRSLGQHRQSQRCGAPGRLPGPASLRSCTVLRLIRGFLFTSSTATIDASTRISDLAGRRSPPEEAGSGSSDRVAASLS